MTSGLQYLVATQNKDNKTCQKNMNIKTTANIIEQNPCKNGQVISGTYKLNNILEQTSVGNKRY